MVKQTSRYGVVAMVAFTAACIGIVLFLWVAFGGSTPLRAEGYRFQVEFPEAGQLTQEADVRISGVNVGKVKRKQANPGAGVTDVTIELQSAYAPIPVGTQAILRQKTLLGETYVELTPAAGAGTRMLADGGTLPAGAVSPTVELDEIFRAFDPDTRRAFSNWMDSQGRAVGDRGAALNAALANLTPFAQDSEDVIRILERQDVATRTLVRDTGEVFGALSERRGQLRGLIENANRVFETTAARDGQLAQAFVALPTFLRETRTTTVRLTKFAELTDPLVTQLRPAARELSPTLIGLQRLAPDLRGLFKDLGPLIEVSRSGLPALERTLDDTKPLLARLEPYLRNLQPVFGYLGLYKREIAAFLALDAASTQVTDIPPGSSRPLHYLRTTNPLNPENLAAYPRRLPSNRSNPYTEPGGYDQLRGGLPVFGRYLCEAAGPASFLGPVGPLLPAELRGLLEQFAFAGSTTGAVPAPACREQAPLGRSIGQSGRYPDLQPIPAP
jgi:phospholipid/cholesterol/gamma-HCH transport system substrate-binding protein